MRGEYTMAPKLRMGDGGGRAPHSPAGCACSPALLEPLILAAAQHAGATVLTLAPLGHPPSRVSSCIRPFPILARGGHPVSSPFSDRREGEREQQGVGLGDQVRGRGLRSREGRKGPVCPPTLGPRTAC